MKYDQANSWYYMVSKFNWFIQKQLAKRRREWAARRDDEKKEQDQLREHEETVVRKLVDQQLAMSESEREKIMAEHEKQMVTLENRYSTLCSCEQTPFPKNRDGSNGNSKMNVSYFI